jgi:hypothetical protein
MNALEQTWDRIHKWLATHCPVVLASLALLSGVGVWRRRVWGPALAVLASSLAGLGRGRLRLLPAVLRPPAGQGERIQVGILTS